MILVGDVGGTKTILAFYELVDGSWHCKKRELYSSGQYNSFLGLLTDFLASAGAPITSACIGVAGPIVNGDCTTTNLPWALKREEIGHLVGTENARLFNDLEAAAWGLLELPDTDFVELNPGRGLPINFGNIAVIAAGTGLGEALMIWDGTDYQVIATEGGHASFAPTDQQQIGLLSYLMQKYDGHVSYERVLSGHGFSNIYDYLKQSQFAPVQSSTEQRMQQEDPGAVIGTSGVAGNDALCVEALNVFCRIYGAEAGNLALKCLSYGGIYITGGIGVKIFPVLENGEFMKSLFNKGRMSDLLKNIPVKVCTNQDVVLAGALGFSKRKLEKNGC